MRRGLREQNERNNLHRVLDSSLRIRDRVRRHMNEKRDRQRQPDDQPQDIKNERDDEQLLAESEDVRREQEMQIDEASESVRRRNAVHDQPFWRGLKNHPGKERSHHQPLVKSESRKRAARGHGRVATIRLWKSNCEPSWCTSTRRTCAWARRFFTSAPATGSPSK